MPVVVPQALVAEFEPELSAKKGKLDSDPHLWMPVSFFIRPVDILALVSRVSGSFP